MQRQEDLIVGLDIGTTKICAVVGEISGSDINIIGIGTHPSIGLRKGVVINIESTVESIKKAVEEAELMAGCEISSVYAGIAGGHITGFNSRGIVAIKGSEISQNDVERVVDAARAVAIPMDREVIHVLPQEFIVDDESGIQNPVGMAGVRLEAKIHIVSGAVASAHNLVKCANRSGLDVSDLVLASHLASDGLQPELQCSLSDIFGILLAGQRCAVFVAQLACKYGFHLGDHRAKYARDMLVALGLGLLQLLLERLSLVF